MRCRHRLMKSSSREGITSLSTALVIQIIKGEFERAGSATEKYLDPMFVLTVEVKRR